MRATVRKAIQVTIPIDLTVEYDKRVMEANIVSASIPELTSVSVRKIHESMSRGDYRDLDNKARVIIIDEFISRCRNLDPSSISEYIRSIPCNPQQWASIITKCYKHCSIPTAVVEKLANSLGVSVEPVFGPKNSLYFWPSDHDEVLADRESQFTKHISSLNNPTMEFLEDNTISVKWNY